MKLKKSGITYIMVLEKGDRIIKSLQEFAQEHHVSGFFHGLGAVSEAEIAYYDLKGKKYHKKKLKGTYEVLNITGNIFRDNDDRKVHAHITLGDTKFNAKGGHLVEGVVSGTLELFIDPTDSIERNHDEDTGLDLLEP